jgi:hypothetical protein
MLLDLKIKSKSIIIEENLKLLQFRESKLIISFIDFTENLFWFIDHLEINKNRFSSSLMLGWQPQALILATLHRKIIWN